MAEALGLRAEPRESVDGVSGGLQGLLMWAPNFSSPESGSTTVPDRTAFPSGDRTPFLPGLRGLVLLLHRLRTGWEPDSAVPARGAVAPRRLTRPGKDAGQVHRAGPHKPR